MIDNTLLNAKIIHWAKDSLSVNTQISLQATLYNALLLSHCNYGILAWGHQWERNVKLQKKIVRITSLSKYNSHTEPILKWKLLKITDILKFHELKFYYKNNNNKLPLYLYNLHFLQNAERHNYFTRAQGNLYIMRPKHEYARYCIRYRIPLIVNESPYTSIQITWPWPPVDRLCHGLIALRQKETWT